MVPSYWVQFIQMGEIFKMEKIITIEEKICDMYKINRYTVTEIAETLKKNRRTISKILKNNKVTIEKNRKSIKNIFKNTNMTMNETDIEKSKYFCRLRHELYNPFDICTDCGEILYYIE